MVVEGAGEIPFILDLGTGLRTYGATQSNGGPYRAVSLVSHLHWDHIQGLPFFSPVLRADAHLDVYAPAVPDGLDATVDRFMCHPFFPVSIGELPGTIVFHEIAPGRHLIGDTEVTAAEVPHIGPTNGYRLERHGVSVAYIPDHQQPVDGSHSASAPVLDLCRGVDLLIHDAQYLPHEFRAKSTWGHCTVEYACWLAREAGARRLALFHHDPSHDDTVMAEIARCAAEWGDQHGIEIVCAREGARVELFAGSMTASDL